MEIKIIKMGRISVLKVNFIKFEINDFGLVPKADKPMA